MAKRVVVTNPKATTVRLTSPTPFAAEPKPEPVTPLPRPRVGETFKNGAGVRVTNPSAQRTKPPVE
jgi:hypothetical protein